MATHSFPIPTYLPLILGSVTQCVAMVTKLVSSNCGAHLVESQAVQTLFVIYVRDSIALRFEPFKRTYENGSKVALNSNL